MLILVFLVAVFVLLALARTGRTAGCRWREDRSARTGTLSHWRCHACGATERTVPGRVPRVCHRKRRAGG
jgi:hypothetical protein